MAAMKPRTGDGPLEVTKEGRGIVLRMPLEGGGRLVVEMNAEEAGALDLALALAARSGADVVLERAQVFDSVAAATIAPSVIRTPLVKSNASVAGALAYAYAVAWVAPPLRRSAA